MNIILLSFFIISTAASFDPAQEHLHLPRSDCIKLCYDYRKFQLSKQVCNPTLNMTPKPAMYKACTHGLFMGFEHACTITCSGETYKEESGVKPGNSFEACKSDTRSSNAMDWCRHAYDVTFKTTPQSIQVLLEQLQQNKTMSDHRIMYNQQNNSPTLTNDDLKQIDHESIVVYDDGTVSMNTQVTRDESNNSDAEIDGSVSMNDAVMNEIFETVAAPENVVLDVSTDVLTDTVHLEMDRIDHEISDEKDEDPYDDHVASAVDEGIYDEMVEEDDEFQSSSLEVFSE